MMMMMMMCWCCWREKNKSIVEACDSHRWESLQGLQHSTVLVKADVPVSPRPQHPSRTSPWAVFGGFPMLLIMCAAGDGSHAMLILLSSSGKYPASLRRTKNNKEPSVAAASGVLRTHQNMSKSHSLLLPLNHLSMPDSPPSHYFSLTLR